MKGNNLWCMDCKTEGHTKGSCPKNQFYEIYQIMGHSIKECPFNMKTKGHQQVFLMQEASASRGRENNDGAMSGGYRNNRRGKNNNTNNNNEGRNRIQYDANGQPMVQCRACNLWGHFSWDYTMANAPKLLCRWCISRDHKDSKCPKSGVNLINIGVNKEVLAITRRQAKLSPDLPKEKKRWEEVWKEIENVTLVENAHLRDTIGTSTRNCTE